jgi:hypothetical protein
VEHRDKDYNKGPYRKDRSQAPQHDLVHSTKVRAGKRRTYFLDVRRTLGNDHYLTITESTKKLNGSFERHKIFLYKEDFNRFMKELESVVNLIKTDLMPEYDYEEFERRQQEWEERKARGEFDDNPESDVENNAENNSEKPEDLKDHDDDMTW